MARLFDMSVQEANTAAGLNTMVWDASAGMTMNLTLTGGRDNKPHFAFGGGTLSLANITPSAGRVFIGFRAAIHNPIGAGFAYHNILYLRVGTTVALCFGWKSDVQQFFIASDSAGANITLIPGVVPVDAATQKYIELDILPAITAVGSVDVYMNGSLHGAVSAVRTHWGASTSYNQFGIGSANGFGGFSKMQDVYMNDASGTTNNTREGDTKIDFVTVDADGSEMDGTAVGAATAWQCVDESVPNDDTDYVLLSAAGDRALFSLAAAGGASLIRCMTLIARYKKDDAGTNDVKIGLRRSGSETLSAAAASSATYTNRRLSIAADPSGGGIMNTSMIDSIEIVMERFA